MLQLLSEPLHLHSSTPPQIEHIHFLICVSSASLRDNIVFEIPKLIVAKQNNHHNGATLT